MNYIKKKLDIEIDKFIKMVNQFRNLFGTQILMKSSNDFL